MTADMADTTLADILASTRILLLDFDGPITALMPDGIDRAIADAMRAELVRLTGAVLAGAEDTKDPLTVLRLAAATEAPDVLAAVEGVCRSGEVDAANRSEPTDGAHDAMRAWHDTGRALVIVSNNAPEAIEAYLDRHGLRDLVQSISARPPGRPDLMKPNTYLVRELFRRHAERPQHYSFVGDSVTDIEVSLAAGVQPIGYGKAAGRANALRHAGAGIVIDDMLDLVRCLR